MKHAGNIAWTGFSCESRERPARIFPAKAFKSWIAGLLGLFMLSGQIYAAVYEAEDAVVSGAAIISEKSGYTGSGYVDYVAASGDYVEWTVTAETSVDRKIYFRYALAKDTDRPLEIRVNGQVVASSLNFPPTGGWKQWAFTAPLTVTLNAGSNTVRATTIGSNGGNVDHLHVLAPGTPPAPEDLFVYAGDTDLLLEWDDGLVPDVVSYNVYRSSTPGSYGAAFATGITTTKFLDQGLINGTTNYYVVTAVDADANESDVSNEHFGAPKPFAYHSLKKGNGMAAKRIVEALESSWYYGWGMGPNLNVNSSIEYIPMRFSRWWPGFENLADCGDFSALLGYNEPERSGQGDTPVDQAIAQWPQLEAAAAQYGALLGSPATATYNHEWITNFMSQAEANNYQVDFMCVHWYKGPNADTLMNNLEWVHTTFGNRDIWITEMNVADWDGSNSYSIYQSYGFWVEALYRMETTDYVKRYAVFPWTGESSASQASPFFTPYSDFKELTPLGHLYAEYRSSDTSGPTVQTWYYLHNQHSMMHLGDVADSPAAATIYTEDDTTAFELVNAGNGNYYIVNKANGQNLQCTGSSVVWSSATDASSQWSVTQAEYCWQYIENAAYAKRLSSSGTSNPSGTAGTLSVSNASTTDDTVKWAFARTPSEYVPAAENTPPSFTVDPINATNATEDVAYSATISNATDADGDTLTYSKLSGPAWLSVAANGVLSGTPVQADVGTNTWSVEVFDGNGGADTATLNMTVVNVNDAPVFPADPIHAASAVKDVAYSATIDNATDEEGDTLTYSRVSGPTWLGVAANGVLSGTPAQADVGTNSWTVQVSDGNGGTDTATLNITVVETAPVVLSSGYSIGSGLLSPNGETLFVDNAVLGGSDLKVFSGWSDTFAVLIDGAGLWNIGDIVEITGFALPVHSASADGDVTFDIRQGAGGIGASGAGGLESLGTVTAYYAESTTEVMYLNFDAPVRFVADTNSTSIGVHISSTAFFRTKVQTSGGSDRYDIVTGDLLTSQIRVSLAGNVIPDVNNPPAFSADPISATNATEDAAYSASIASASASDADGDSLTYSKVSGPAWLNVATNGVLSGTPAQADVGPNSWTVQVSDGNGGSDTATLNITVIATTDTPLSLYQAWLVDRGYPTNAPIADYLAEYGTDGTLPSGMSDGTHLYYTHVEWMNAVDRGLIYEVQRAEDLTSPSWNSTNVVVESSVDDSPNAGKKTVIHKVTKDTPVQFMRLRIEYTP